MIWGCSIFFDTLSMGYLVLTLTEPACTLLYCYHYQVQHSARPETSHWLLLLCPGLPAPQPEAARPDGPGSVEQHALTAGQESHQLELRAAPALSQRGPTVPENKTEQSAEQHEQLHHGLRQLHEHCHAVQYRLLYVARDYYVCYVMCIKVPRSPWKYKWKRLHLTFNYPWGTVVCGVWCVVVF